MKGNFRWNNTRTAVLGGGGFLGRHVVAVLEEMGGRPVVPRTRDGYDFRSLDVARCFMAEAKPEVVFQCAAHQGGIAYQGPRPVEILQDNLLIAMNTLAAAREAGVRKFVNVVAACSYPGHLDRPLSEDDYWAGPIHDSVMSYGLARKVSVVLGSSYRREYGLNCVHLILANLYGPGDHIEPDRSHALIALLRKMIEAHRDGSPTVTVWGTGRPIREWLYVRDAAEALVLAAESYDLDVPLNVGTGEGLSIAALADLIRDVVGYSGRIVFDTSRPDGAMVKTLRCERIRAALGWQPRTPLREGLERTRDWLEGHLSIVGRK